MGEGGGGGGRMEKEEGGGERMRKDEGRSYNFDLVANVLDRKGG